VERFFRPEPEPAAGAALNGSSPFRWSWRSDGVGEWAALTGEFDIAQAPLFERSLERVEAGGARLIVLDLRKVSFIDLSGMRVFTRASERLQQAGGRLIVVRGPRAVEMVFMLTGADETLEILDLETALEVVRDLTAAGCP